MPSLKTKAAARGCRAHTAVQPGCRAGSSQGQEQLEACGGELQSRAMAGGGTRAEGCGALFWRKATGGSQEKLSPLFLLRVGRDPVASSGPSGLADLTSWWLQFKHAR